jgi:tetratricopeptide (TPR) repeat protein
MYYARFLEKIESTIVSSREQAALDALELEYDNLRGAWQRAIEVKKWEALDKIVHPIMLYYAGRSMSAEGSEALKLLADALQADGGGNTLTYWRTRIRQAWLSSRTGKYEDVYQIANGANDFFKRENQLIEMTYALNTMSYARMMQGKLQEAYDLASEANEYVNDMLDKTAWFMSMGNLAYVTYLMGNYDEARILYESIIHTGENEEVDYSPSGIAHTKNNLGELLRAMGEIAEARRLFEQAYDTFEKINHKRGMAFTLNNLAGMYFYEGTYGQSKEMYERSYQLNREIGDLNGLGHSLSALGNIASTQRDYPAAKGYFEEALRIRRHLGEKRGIADSTMDLVAMEVNRNGDMNMALRMATEALAIYQEAGDREGSAYVLPLRTVVNYRLKRMEEARADADMLMEMAQSLNNPGVLAQAYMVKGEVEFYGGNYDAAMQHYKTALKMGQTSGIVGIMLYVLTGIAGVLNATGEHRQALRIVTLVLLYPTSFIAEAETRARELQKELQSKLAKNVYEETMQHSKSIELQQLVAEILGE